MTIQELIYILQNIEDKNKEVVIYNEYDGVVYPIDFTDFDINDRLDIQVNIKGN